MVLIYILPIMRTTSRIVQDKPLRAYMEVMGLTEIAYWTTWFLYYIGVSTTISVIGASMLRINVL